MISATAQKKAIPDMDNIMTKKTVERIKYPQVA